MQEIGKSDASKRFDDLQPAARGGVGAPPLTSAR
jgi:hypothetical protein